MKIIVHCVSCKFFDEKFNVCRFNPPTVIPNIHGTYFAIFPEVEPNKDWCGKLEDKLDEK